MDIVRAGFLDPVQRICREIRKLIVLQALTFAAMLLLILYVMW